MTRRSRICLALLALAVLVVASCDSGSDNSGASKRGHSIEGMLGEIPASAFDDSGRLQIVTGDLDLATEAAGLKRPAADTDPGSTGLLDDWLLPLKGADRGFEEKMATLLPDVANHDFVDNGAIADELGWSLVDVHSFIELQNVPEVFTVLAADVTAKDLTDAIGPPDHDIWSLGGDDSAINVDETSAARPLGGSVRMALHDGLLAMSRSTPPVEDWLTGDVDTLADKKALAAVAQALDDAGVYSAMLVEADFSIPTLLTTQLTPEQLAQFEQLTQGVDPLRPFDALGTGLRVDEAGKPVATFVYHHADAATAKANATIIKNAFSKGFSLMKHRPLSELFAVQDVKVDGDVVIATIGFKEALPVEVWHMIANSDGPTTYG